MKLVYICSPYAGDINGNTELARAYCAAAVSEGVLPLASHLLFPQFLDDSDPKQRELGLKMGLQLLEQCEELWICDPRHSRGMRAEIAHAEKLDIPVLEQYHLLAEQEHDRRTDLCIYLPIKSKSPRIASILDVAGCGNLRGAGAPRHLDAHPNEIACFSGCGCRVSVPFHPL